MGLEIISFTSFTKAIRAGDSKRFKINLKKNRKQIVEEATEEALTKPPILSPHSSTKIRGRHCVSYRRYNDNLVIRAITDYLRRRLRVATLSRQSAVEGIIQSLTDGTELHVLRRDVKDFYESVNVTALKERLLFDPLVTPRIRKYLHHFFHQHCPAPEAGIPRGIGLSALLAELHMQSFDRKVRALPGVYRYFRYADDIVVFSSSPPTEIAGKIQAALPEGMVFNADKSEDISLLPVGDRQKFDYLGYEFAITAPKRPNEGRSIRVSMSSRKLSRLKSRIIVSAKAFAKTGDFALFYDRLRFLSSNYEVKRHGQRSIATATHVRSGLYYNYRHCGQYTVNKSSNIDHKEWDASELRSIDGFLNSLLFGATSRIRPTIAPKLNAAQRSQIKRLSFYHGYGSRILMRVTPHQVGDIKAVWRNV